MGKLVFSPIMLALIGLMFVTIAGINAAESEAQGEHVYQLAQNEVQTEVQTPDDANGTVEQK